MKGRPPLEPRITALEQRCAAIEMTAKAHQSWTEDVALQVKALEKRIEFLERHAPKYPDSYQSQFEKWPGNGSPPQ